MPSGWFPLYYFPDHCSDLLHALIYCWFPLVYFSFQLLYSSLLIFLKYFIPLADTLSSSIPLSCSLNILGQRLKHLPAMWETRFDPWVEKIPWRRKWQPTPVFLPGKSHGQRSLVGYTPWGSKELDMTEWLHFITLNTLCWKLLIFILFSLFSEFCLGFSSVKYSFVS